MNENVKRILLVDDNEAIHDDFHQILQPVRPSRNSESARLENELFGREGAEPADEFSDGQYQLDDAYQGEEAIRMVDAAAEEGRPYSLIFMDVRMPPGMDGIMTIKEIWKKHPHVEMVICTAYSDYSWDQILEKFGRTDHLLFIKKPFDNVSIKQTAQALTTKWALQLRDLEQRERLETEVLNRTLELRKMVSHLERLKEAAETATIAKSEFLSNISHEIRTPLNGILGMTDLLLDTDLKNEQKDYAEIIKSSGQSLLVIVNDVLNYSKTEAGKVELEVIDFDVRTTVENVIDLVSISAVEKGVEMASLIHAHVPNVLLGDPERLRQILLNLCSNAVKFTGKGEIAVSVCVEEGNVRPEGGWAPGQKVKLLFEVTDTGIGLSEGAQTRIFEPFSQADASTTRKYGGTGLGLAISKMLCELMKGQIGVKSRIGEGSTFWFTAEFCVGEDVAHAQVPPAESLEGTKILTLSDNQTSRKVLSLYIRHWGAKCKEAQDIKGAVDLLQTELDAGIPFDLAIVEYRDGERERFVQAAEEIKRHGKLRGIPLICITSKAKRGDALALKEHGYCSYLTKPIKQNHLFSSISMIRHGTPAMGDEAGVQMITKHLVDEIFSIEYRVLVVDDNPVNRKLMVSILRKIGIRSDVAQSGTEAVAAASRNKYDMILMDCLMPDMDGFEATRHIRQGESGPEGVPIVAVTADISDETKRKCLAAGMDDFITKPYTKEMLLELLKKRLKKT